MKLPSIIVIILLLLSSCSNIQDTSLTFDDHYPIGEISIIKIQMNKGQILVKKSAVDQILIKGTTHQPEDLSITQDEGTLVLVYEESTTRDQLEIHLPGEISLDIQAFNVDIELNGLIGNTNIRNTAGDITLNEYKGETYLWAGRGDIKVAGGEGKAVVIGEHGSLSVSQFSGPVSMTTIMGNIQFRGAENTSGDILMEVDHGSVRAELPRTSSYLITIDSASGEIVCRGGNLERTITGCTGSTGDRSGILHIRTVSGRIEFLILP